MKLHIHGLFLKMYVFSRNQSARGLRDPDKLGKSDCTERWTKASLVLVFSLDLLTITKMQNIALSFKTLKGITKAAENVVEVI